MDPLVSILVPAYNAEQTLAETLVSAVNQTWSRTEIIVVDDGSTDDTLSVARRFASTTVKVVTKVNEGAAATRNHALSLCQGDHIQWLDADDMLAPLKVESQVLRARQFGERRLLSGPWARFILRPQAARFIPTLLWDDLSPLEWQLRKMEHNLHMQTATWLVSRQLTDRAGPWNTRLLGDDDGEYFHRVLMQSDGVTFVPAAKVFYRMPGPKSLSYIGRSDSKLDAQYRSMQMQIASLRSIEDGPRVRAACVVYLQTWLSHFHPQRPDIVGQARRLATDLGGCLVIPRTPRKYAWIEAAAGYKAARWARAFLPRLRWSLVRLYERIACRVDGAIAKAAIPSNAAVSSRKL